MSEPPSENRLLEGWGRTPVSASPVVEADSGEAVAKALADPHPRGVIGRGLGRSYGDSALNAGGAVIETTGVSGLRSLDLESGLVTADAGTSLDDLMRWLVPLGWFVPTTPGTRYVTVGGAIASDIHGKNHHIDGSFCSSVEAITLLLPSGERRVVSPTTEPALFWATAGGMGLTGLILDATFRLRRISTSSLVVDTERARDLDDCMARMEAGDDDYRYSVAWVDCAAQGPSFGRSIITRGDFATVDQLPDKAKRAPLAFAPKQRLAAPPLAPSWLLSKTTVIPFNELWFRMAPKERRGQIQTIPTFFHPLDGVRGWNRLYGPRGFLQHQCVVPFGQEDTIRTILGRFADSGFASFVTVLKRMGPGNPGPLSFPMPGWTLNLDIPVGRPGLGALLDGFDDLVVAAGGRLYLAKDSCMRPELLAAMYPRLDEWRALRASVDPDGVLSSDQSRRLRL